MAYVTGAYFDRQMGSLRRQIYAINAANMNKIEDAIAQSLRQFTIAVMEQIEREKGIPFFNAEELSEDIEEMFLEQMRKTK